MNTDGIRVWEVIGELQHHVSNAGMTVNGAKTWQNQTQFGWSQSAVLRVELRMKYCSLSTLSKIRDISGEDIEHVLCYFIICSNHPLITECQKITFQAFLSKYGFVIDFLRGNNIYLLLHCAGWQDRCSGSDGVRWGWIWAICSHQWTYQDVRLVTQWVVQHFTTWPCFWR